MSNKFVTPKELKVNVKAKTKHISDMFEQEKGYVLECVDSIITKYLADDTNDKLIFLLTVSAYSDDNYERKLFEFLKKGYRECIYEELKKYGWRFRSVDSNRRVWITKKFMFFKYKTYIYTDTYSISISEVIKN